MRTCTVVRCQMCRLVVVVVLMRMLHTILLMPMLTPMLVLVAVLVRMRVVVRHGSARLLGFVICAPARALEAL